MITGSEAQGSKTKETTYSPLILDVICFDLFLWAGLFKSD